MTLEEFNELPTEAQRSIVEKIVDLDQAIMAQLRYTDTDSSQGTTPESQANHEPKSKLAHGKQESGGSDAS